MSDFRIVMTYISRDNIKWAEQVIQRQHTRFVFGSCPDFSPVILTEICRGFHQIPQKNHHTQHRFFPRFFQTLFFIKLPPISVQSVVEIFLKQRTKQSYMRPRHASECQSREQLRNLQEFRKKFSSNTFFFNFMPISQVRFILVP